MANAAVQSPDLARTAMPQIALRTAGSKCRAITQAQSTNTAAGRIGIRRQGGYPPTELAEHSDQQLLVDKRQRVADEADEDQNP